MSFTKRRHLVCTHLARSIKLDNDYRKKRTFIDVSPVEARVTRYSRKEILLKTFDRLKRSFFTTILPFCRTPGSVNAVCRKFSRVNMKTISDITTIGMKLNDLSSSKRRTLKHINCYSLIKSCKTDRLFTLQI